MNVSEARAVLRLMGYRLVVWAYRGSGSYHDGPRFKEFTEVFYDVVPDKAGFKHWPRGSDTTHQQQCLRNSKGRRSIQEAKKAFLEWMEAGCQSEQEYGT